MMSPEIQTAIARRSRAQVPANLDRIWIAARYVMADCDECVSGDAYGAAETPYGSRFLIADVMGRGEVALGQATTILDAWQHLVSCERSQAGIAIRLDTIVKASARPDQFVTALMVTVPEIGPAELVCCGHPPPLVSRNGAITYASVPSPAPPLGLLDLGSGWCAASIVPLLPGDRLLLYTDGVTEARDSNGRFFPLLERFGALSDGPPAPAVAALEEALISHVGGRIGDDAAMMLLQRDRRDG